MAKQPKQPKRPNPDKPLTTNQMVAMFREVLEPHRAGDGSMIQTGRQTALFLAASVAVVIGSNSLFLIIFKL